MINIVDLIINIFTLIFVVFSIIIGLKMASKYFEFRKKEFIPIGQPIFV